MDKRRTPARPEIAAAHLRGQVEAKEFVEGEPKEVGVAVLNLTLTVDPDAGLATQLLMGEGFTVYKNIPEMGLCWGQSTRDNYVGYVAAQGLQDVSQIKRETVSAVSALIYEQPSLKARAIGACSFGCALEVGPDEEGHRQITGWGYIPSIYMAPLQTTDYVDIAERFLHVPYLWGGRSAHGLDCSALIQLSLQAVGQDAPRDTDMQVVELGALLDTYDDLARGDLVFWDGHVGMMRDSETLLHANAHHMAVASEPLVDAVVRIEASGGGAITAVRRP